MSLAPHLEYILLKPSTTLDEVVKLCNDAQQEGVAAVCVPPLFVKNAKQLLQSCGVKVATAIGYPLGYSAIEAKLAEILLSIVDGADELNVVINYMAIKNNDWGYIAQEINHILPVVKSKDKILKVIIESAELTADEITKCCELYGAAGVDFLDTATGYRNPEVNLDFIKEMRLKLAASTQLKITIDNVSFSFGKQLVDAGVKRIGVTMHCG